MEAPIYTQQYHIDSYIANCKGEIQADVLSDIFSSIAITHSEILGVDVGELGKLGQTWMLHRLNVTIDSMPLRGESITISTGPCGIDKLFALRKYRVTRGGNEIARAQSEWMVIDIAKRRPVRPAGRLVEINRPLQPDADLPTATITHRNLPDDMREARTFRAAFSDIDFNGHVTQASYMKWITDTPDFGFVRSHSLAAVEIVYEHEIMPDSTVISWIKEERNGNRTEIWHKLTSADGSTLHCYAKTIWTDAK